MVNFCQKNSVLRSHFGENRSAVIFARAEAKKNSRNQIWLQALKYFFIVSDKRRLLHSLLSVAPSLQVTVNGEQGSALLVSDNFVSRGNSKGDDKPKRQFVIADADTCVAPPCS